jgi:S1-C subfamily serine protease
MIGRTFLYLTVFISVLAATSVPGGPKLGPLSAVHETQATDANYSSIDLGFTYLQVTAAVSKHYGLGVNSGALITQVSQDSLLRQAEVKPGDVIISFNGVYVGSDSPLLGMILGCHAGDEVTLEIWNPQGLITVEIDTGLTRVQN